MFFSITVMSLTSSTLGIKLSRSSQSLSSVRLISTLKHLTAFLLMSQFKCLEKVHSLSVCYCKTCSRILFWFIRVVKSLKREPDQFSRKPSFRLTISTIYINTFESIKYCLYFKNSDELQSDFIKQSMLF